MEFGRVKFQLVVIWYDDCRYMAVKSKFTKKAGLMLWLIDWFLENYQRYTLKRLPGAYQNTDKVEKIMNLDLDKLAALSRVAKKMRYYKPTDVLNWAFYNIQSIIEIQEQIQDHKDSAGSL